MSGPTDATGGVMTVATRAPSVALRPCLDHLPWRCPDRHAQVYRMFDEAGRCLYVGQTTDAGPRLRQHQRVSPWLHLVDSVEWGPPVTWDAADREEVVVTEILRPLFSRRFNPDYDALTKAGRDALYAERLAALIPQMEPAA